MGVYVDVMLGRGDVCVYYPSLNYITPKFTLNLNIGLIPVTALRLYFDLSAYMHISSLYIIYKCNTLRVLLYMYYIYI